MRKIQNLLLAGGLAGSSLFFSGCETPEEGAAAGRTLQTGASTIPNLGLKQRAGLGLFGGLLELDALLRDGSQPAQAQDSSFNEDISNLPRYEDRVRGIEYVTTPGHVPFTRDRRGYSQVMSNNEVFRVTGITYSPGVAKIGATVWAQDEVVGKWFSEMKMYEFESKFSRGVNFKALHIMFGPGTQFEKPGKYSIRWYINGDPVFNTKEIHISP